MGILDIAPLKSRAVVEREGRGGGGGGGRTLVSLSLFNGKSLGNCASSDFLVIIVICFKFEICNHKDLKRMLKCEM